MILFILVLTHVSTRVNYLARFVVRLDAYFIITSHIIELFVILDNFVTLSAFLGIIVQNVRIASHVFMVGIGLTRYTK